MLLSELKAFDAKYPITYREALNAFAERRGLTVSEGSNARVLWAQGKGYAWRLWFDDDGFERFIEFVKAHSGSPHLPKLLSKVREEPVQFKGMPAGMTIKFIRLEKLDELDVGSLSDAIDAIHGIPIDKAPDSIEKLEKMIRDGKLKLPSHSDLDHDEVAEEIMKHPVFFKLYLELLKNNGNDMSSGNVMMRGQTPVICDPFSD